MLVPAIATSPLGSTAIAPPSSVPLPPINVRYTSELGPVSDGLIFAMKKSVAPVGPRRVPDCAKVAAEVVVPPRYTFPAASSAMLCAVSLPVPPRNVL